MILCFYLKGIVSLGEEGLKRASINSGGELKGLSHDYQMSFRFGLDFK